MEHALNWRRYVLRTGGAVLAVLLCVAAPAALGAEPVVRDAYADDPYPGPPGERPYEMAERLDDRLPFVEFDDVTGWKVECVDAEAELCRTEDRKLYAPYCTKLVYAGKGANPSVVVRPPDPIPIPDPWDCVNLWTWGNNWGWVPDASTPVVALSALVRDANWHEIEIPLGNCDSKYWFLAHGQLAPGALRDAARPFVFTGLRVTNGRNTEKRTLYLGPIYFYGDEWEPLEFDPWPANLPFPTRPETILPTNKAPKYTNLARKEGDTIIFSYSGPDCEMEYRYTPRHPSLSDIELHFGERVIRPCAGGGLQLSASDVLVPPDEARTTHTLLDLSFDKDTLYSTWAMDFEGTSTLVEYRMKMVAKSLIVEILASEPVVERVALGRTEGISNARLVRVPYLTYGGNDPRLLCSDGLFGFMQFDWYVSDASVLEGAAEAGWDWARHNGGAVYNRLTDGTRNRVRERLFITFSPDAQEVLPTVPNPASPMKDVQGGRLWRVKFGADYEAEKADAARLRRLGMENVTVRYHEETWRDAGESFTFRVDAAPAKGGDAALAAFVRDVQALGWKVGLYTNYTDFAPVNSLWDENWVTRRSDGNWLRAWPRCYAPKPMRAVEAQAVIAPMIHEKFGENHSYCDVHTAVTPFSRVDYDHRVPGAGTFRRTFECFGRLLHNEKTAHNGPVYSEGLNHWWYAGLTDGNYAQLLSPAPHKEPLFVDFDLLKLHPLQMDAGMGSPEMFFRAAPRDLDQFIATTLAYGHIGFLEWGDLAGHMRIYYMLQQVQKRYAMEPVSEILYDHNGTLLDTSKALAAGACPGGRVHVKYANGTQVYVNALESTWTVPGWTPDSAGRAKPAEAKWVLPRWGYAAWNEKEGVVSVSALVPPCGAMDSRGGPRRADLAIGGGQWYADSRGGGFVHLGALAIDGAAAVKKENDRWVAIPAGMLREIAFDPAALGLAARGGVEVTAVAADGTTLTAPAVRWSRGMLHVVAGAERTSETGTVRYEMRAAGRNDLPPLLETTATLAVAGDTIAVTVPAAAGKVESTAACWETETSRMAAEASITGNVLTVRVPATVADGSRLWLSVSTANAILWLDFVGAAR